MYNWIYLKLFTKNRRGIVAVMFFCGIYQLCFWHKTSLGAFLHIDYDHNVLLHWLEPGFDYLYEFITHYFPDLIAAVTIYIMIDEGIKILVGTREEENRNYKDLMAAFESDKKTKREIIIHDTFVNEFINEVTSEEVERVFTKCLERNIKIKILILSPSSQAAQQRIRDLEIYSKNPSRLRSQVKNNIIFLFTFYEKIKKRATDSTLGFKDPLFGKLDNLKILLYDRSASMSYYSWDDVAYFSLITPDGPTDAAPNLIISNYSLFGNYTKKIFDQMINGATKNPPISIDNYMLMRLEATLLEPLHILEKQNKLFLGYQNLRDPLPQYITAKKNYDNLHRYFHANMRKVIEVKYQDKKIKIRILKVLTYHERNQRGCEYDIAIRKINKLYCFDKNYSEHYFGQNPDIYMIQKVEK